MSDPTPCIPVARRNASYSIIAPDGRFYWRAIPKNATTSLRRLLAPRGLTLREAAEKQITPAWTFAVVRHPERRIVSAWLNKLHPDVMAKGHPVIVAENPGLRFGMPLEDFVDWLADDLAKPAPSNAHWTPQHHFIFNRHGERMADYLARFETLSVDLKAVEERIGSIETLGHDGQTRSSEVVVPAATSRKLRNLYSADFELFGYD